MKMLDSFGRLFGKVSVLDIGAGLIIFLVIFGIFVYPSTTGVSIAQLNENTKNIEVELVVRGLSVVDRDDFVKSLLAQKKTNIVIRNQPQGEVEIKSIQVLPDLLAVPQPDGNIKALPDPRPEVKTRADLQMVIVGKGSVTNDGAVIGGSKIKIGTPVRLEGPKYDFNTSVIDVRY